jgi:hypothetical protein
MSTTIFKLIPSDPQYIPAGERQLRAMDVLRSSFHSCNDIKTSETGDVQFIDAGNNLESIFCTKCGMSLSMDWWIEAMDALYEANKFSNLFIKTPCCETPCSLNDLRYVLPVGFARFVIEITDCIDNISDDLQKELEDVLGCSLKKVWAYY